MALGVYPFNIPVFPVHKNLLDDVDANHINIIQRELSTGLGILGVNPHIESDVAVPQPSVATLPSGFGDVTDTITFSPFRATDPQVRARDHGTVGNRLDRLTQNRHVSCFKLAGSSIPIGTGTPLSTPQFLRLPLPNPAWDPEFMYNGAGVVLRKSGFWTFTGSVYFTRQGDDASGVYQASIDRDGQWGEGSDRDTVSSNAYDPVLNPTLQGFFERGTTISLRVAHTAATNQFIALASLSGYLLRES